MRRCLRCGMIGHESQGCSFRKTVCWSCHQPGHHSASCQASKEESSGAGLGACSASVGGSTASSGQKRKNLPTVEARAFQMRFEAATANDDVITDMFFISSIPVRVLFDSCANRTFMSIDFLLPIPSFNVVLGINWMSLHKAHIKCDKKIVTFRLSDVT
ncbi:uncharacterized protein [Rutidosis leptorrhynchoides]|uniref:uncharacterized protein n=1 Tax=Rutidosis leptorrhynchoides TaxID=125765 RepID=UPI003A999ECE